MWQALAIFFYFISFNLCKSSWIGAVIIIPILQEKKAELAQHHVAI